MSFSIGREPEQSGVSAMLEDREGNIWVGTVKDGLYRLRPRRIKTWTTEDGLPDNEVRSVSAAPDGSVWAATKRGLAQIKDRQLRTFANLEPTRPAAKLVWAAQDGGIWTYKERYGIRRFDGRQFTQPFTPPEQGGLFIDTLYENRDGKLSIGLDRAVWVLETNQFQCRFDRAIIGHPVVAILEDQNGDMWLGTQGGGAKRFADGKLTSFTTTNGLSDNRVKAFHADAEGGIWIGTEIGLNRFKEGRLTQFGIREGLVETMINHILEDEFGNIWLSGLRGIYRVPHAQLDAVAEGRTNAVQCLAYGEPDGMARAETNGERQPAGCKSSNGHLWFPSNKGVVEIDPGLTQAKEVLPLMVIEQVKADGQVIFGDGYSSNFVAADVRRLTSTFGTRSAKAEIDQSLLTSAATVTLAPGRARVMEIRYTANSLTAPEKVRFKYKLEPNQREWHDAGAQRVAFFTNLRPGDYLFRVKACDHHGLWNEAGAGFRFSLAPHFYETWLFYLLCGIGTLAGVVAIHFWRVRFLHRIERLEQQQAVQVERGRIARDLHDELGSRLTALAMRAELAARDSGGAGGKDERAVAEESRALAERMRDVIWAVDPECDSLEAFVARLTEHAEDFARSAGIRLRLELPENLPALPLSADARHQLAMVTREALHNVLKHARASEVRLGMELRDGELRLRVSDDGVGFDESRRDGRGLANMKTRIAPSAAFSKSIRNAAKARPSK